MPFTQDSDEAILRVYQTMATDDWTDEHTDRLFKEYPTFPSKDKKRIRQRFKQLAGWFADYTNRVCMVKDCAAEASDQGRCQAHSAADVAGKTTTKIRKVCSVLGCSTFTVGRGLCAKHGGRKTCSVDGCSFNATARGVCRLHDKSTQTSLALEDFIKNVYLGDMPDLAAQFQDWTI
jgi:hypothetical protein